MISTLREDRRGNFFGIFRVSEIMRNYCFDSTVHGCFGHVISRGVSLVGFLS